MNNFKLRVITGFILIAVITSSVIIHPYTFISLILFINILALREFYTLFQCYTPRKLSGLILSTCLFATTLSVIGYRCDWKILLISIPITFCLFIKELYTKSERPFLSLAFTFLGILYITVPCVLLVGIAFLPFPLGMYHPNYILGLFLLVWASDSGAYAAGKLFGKHALFARISPKKTWEGSVGGTISAIIIAFIASHFFLELDLLEWVIIAMIVVIIGTFGDFVKSLLKRSLQIKDSGTILPGHGGILDRFDSLLASAPFVFAYLAIIKN